MAGTLVIDTITTTTGKPPTVTAGEFCRARVNFNGLVATPTVRDSFNVTSITDNGTGDYTVNYSTAMANADYSVAPSVGQSTYSSAHPAWNFGTKVFTTTSVRMISIMASSGVQDVEYATLVVFGD